MDDGFVLFDEIWSRKGHSVSCYTVFYICISPNQTSCHKWKRLHMLDLSQIFTHIRGLHNDYCTKCGTKCCVSVVNSKSYI